MSAVSPTHVSTRQRHTYAAPWYNGNYNVFKHPVAFLTIFLNDIYAKKKENQMNDISHVEANKTNTDDDYSDRTLTDDDIQEMINSTYDQTGYTWPELQKQAEKGSFSSEVARRTWFVVSSFA